MNKRLIPVTDSQGRLMLTGMEAAEPAPGSVVLTEGEHGTAWQRHFSDGLWHPTLNASPRTWEYLCVRRNVVLLYDAPERKAS